MTRLCSKSFSLPGTFSRVYCTVYSYMLSMISTAEVLYKQVHRCSLCIAGYILYQVMQPTLYAQHAIHSCTTLCLIYSSFTLASCSELTCSFTSLTSILILQYMHMLTTLGYCTKDLHFCPFVINFTKITTLIYAYIHTIYIEHLQHKPITKATLPLHENKRIHVYQMVTHKGIVQ